MKTYKPTKEDILDSLYYEASKDPQFEEYISALCNLAATYVSRIRKQFADKAVEKFQDATIRKLVLAYGEEVKKQNEYRLRQFKYEARWGENEANRLNDDHLLIHDQEYEKAIYFLFDIDKETANEDHD